MDIPRFEVEHCLGYSSHGPVWQVSNSAGELFAAKTVPAADLIADPVRLPKVAGVPPILHCLPGRDGLRTVIMPIVTGVPLRQVLHPQADSAHGWMLQLYQAIIGLHASGFVHGRINSQHVIVNGQKLFLLGFIPGPKRAATLETRRADWEAWRQLCRELKVDSPRVIAAHADRPRTHPAGTAVALNVVAGHAGPLPAQAAQAAGAAVEVVEAGTEVPEVMADVVDAEPAQCEPQRLPLRRIEEAKAARAHRQARAAAADAADAAAEAWLRSHAPKAADDPQPDTPSAVPGTVLVGEEPAGEGEAGSGARDETAAPPTRQLPAYLAMRALSGEPQPLAIPPRRAINYTARRAAKSPARRGVAESDPVSNTGLNRGRRRGREHGSQPRAFGVFRRLGLAAAAVSMVAGVVTVIYSTAWAEPEDKALKQAVVELVHTRDEIINSANWQGLGAISVADSPQLAADQAMASQLQESGATILELHTVVENIEVEDLEGPRARVRALLTQQRHRRCVEHSCVEMPQLPSRDLIMELHRVGTGPAAQAAGGGDSGWRLYQVQIRGALGDSQAQPAVPAPAPAGAGDAEAPPRASK